MAAMNANAQPILQYPHYAENNASKILTVTVIIIVVIVCSSTIQRCRHANAVRSFQSLLLQPYCIRVDQSKKYLWKPQLEM
jgi:hypothetical protein